MSDTRQEAEMRFRRMILSRSPARRPVMASRIFETARWLALAGIARAQDPGGPALRRRLFLRFYGADFDPAQREKILDFLGAG